MAMRAPEGDFYALNAATIFGLANDATRTEVERVRDIAHILKLMRCDVPLKPMLRAANEIAE